MSILRAIAIAIVLVGFGRFALAEDAPASQPAAAAVVDFQKLKDLLPTEAAGIARSSSEGEKQSVSEFTMSHAKGEYIKPNAADTDPKVTIEISDFGADSEMLAGMAVWKTVPMNIENDQGFQRTTQVKNNAAFETYEKDGDARKMMIVVSDRYLVSIEASQVTQENFKKLVETVDLKKLAELK